MSSSLPSLQPNPQKSSSLMTLLHPQLQAINACILENLANSVELIPQVANHLISLGGKRLRPLLTVASAELFGYEGNRHIYLAACIELIHTVTLLHDDVVDESQMRRGKASVNSLWDNKTSILVGDFLFSRAFELMVADGNLEILKIISKTTSAIAEGEVRQLNFSHQLTLSQSEYLEIIRLKTARLFSTALEVGAIVGQAPVSQQKALSEFGLNLGIAFQLMDDCLDYKADPQKLGKNVGDDFREGKVTLPVLLAYQKGIDRPFWKKVFEDEDQEVQSFSNALKLLKTSGAFDETEKLAENFVHKAAICLQGFPDSPLKEALSDLAYSSLHRES